MFKKLQRDAYFKIQWSKVNIFKGQFLTKMHTCQSNQIFWRLLTIIYKQKAFTLRIGDQTVQKLNFYIKGGILISEKHNVDSSGIVWKANWAIVLPPLFTYQYL